MRELESLARSGEDHGMFADDRAAAERRKADRAAFARTGRAIARAQRMFRQCDAAPARGSLAQKQSGAGGRVDLHAMMRLDDFDVVIGSKRTSRLFDERSKQVHAKTHIAGFD